MVFKKGQISNPSGRPKGALGVKALIKKYWNMPVKLENGEIVTDDSGDIVTNAHKATVALVKKAQTGDIQAYKLLAERMEGMPKQEMDINANITKMDKIVKDGKEVEFDIGEPLKDNEDDS